MINVTIPDFSNVYEHVNQNEKFIQYLKEKKKLEEKNQEFSQESNVEGLIEDFFEKVNKLVKSNKKVNIVGSEEEKEKKDIFKYFNGNLMTQGYVGVIKYDEVVINIISRFDSNKNQNFLMYIFQTSFNSKGFIFKDMEIPSEIEKTWDLLLFFTFANQLNTALKKGFYKEYKEYEMNDAKVKGRVDIARHIKLNNFSKDRMAYNTREYTVDNDINRLIIKASYIFKKKYPKLFNNLVNNDDVVKKNLIQLENELIDSISIMNHQLLKNVKKKIVRSTDRNYEPLRKTSILILKRYGYNSFVPKANSMNGFLIDMTKLWEEYLYHQIFRELINGPKKYKQEKFEILNGKRILEPDFQLEDKKIVIDAKYKNNWVNSLDGEGIWENTREDVFQILTYVLSLDYQVGGVIFPAQIDKSEEEIEEIMNEIQISSACPNKYFMRIPYAIPEEIEYSKFVEEISKNEERILNKLKSI